MKFISPFRAAKKTRSDDPFSIREGEFRYGGLEGFSYRTEWTEDTFYLDAGKKEVIGRNFDFSKLKFFAIFACVLLFLLVGRTAYLQALKGSYYYSMAEGNRVRVERIEPKRGVIYDRHGHPLARNIANFMLYLVPYDLPREEAELNKILDGLPGYIGDFDKTEIIEALKKIKIGSMESYRPMFVKDNLDYDNAMKLYLAADKIPGVVVISRTRREYNLHSLTLPHVLGYTGKINAEELEKYGDDYSPIDYIGKMGIEYFWENDLKGTAGEKRIEVDALGKEKKIISKQDPVDGHNLILSLDLEMQKKLEEVMLKQLEKLKLTKASAVILDPNNGEVLSMVSIPSYNNNIFARGVKKEEYKGLIEHPDRPLFNRVVSGEFPSGSTIKPVWSASALEEGLINENTSFVSNGGLRIGQWFFPDWKAGGHGVTNVKKAIAQSVNTFYYYIGGGYNEFKGLGIDKMVTYGKLFGLGSQTGIDLAGEANGFMPSKEWKEETKGEKWYIGDTYHLAIGQGDLLATPLQVANFIAFFANGGSLYRPHLIKGILSGNDKPLESVISAPVRENFIKDENVKIVREGMRETVVSGSARRLSSLPVETAGKTGTAQWSTKKDPHAWYVGFAPYEKSELAYAILVEEGKEGSSVCVPIMEEFLKWYFGEYKKN